MYYEDSSNTDVAVNWLSPFIGAAVGFSVAYWVWPWLGPQILNPCPQWTSLGVGLYTAWKTLKAVGGRYDERRLKRIEAKLMIH